VRETHAPASKIYSQARDVHAAARGGPFDIWRAADRSGGSPNHGSVAREKVELPKVDKSDFEKIKSKNLWK
jgi:uncharacterized protein YjhX (UPF0386 family)